MKNIKILSVIAVYTLLFIGCSDAIDIEQKGRLGAEQAFQTVNDLNSGILKTYDELDVTNEIQFNSVFTDEISIGFDNGGQGLSDGSYGFVLNPSSDFSESLWNNSYDALNSANRIIEAAELITPESNEQVQYNNILGEAYAIRAFSHFTLLSYLTPDYTDDSALATILLDFVPTIDQNLPRNTNGEIFASIDSDLSKANSLLTEQSNPTYISKDFVTALKARMAAYRGQYSIAEGYADTLLAKYDIANQAQFLDMFTDTDNTEIIFKLARTVGDNYDGQGSTGSGFAGGWAGANYAFINATLAGSPYFEMSRAVFNLLDPSDIRYTSYVDDSSLIDSDYLTNQNPADDILVIKKYPGKDGQPLMNDLKIFRVSEMLFIKAEALADAGDFNGTATLIKQLRDARFGSAQDLPVYNTEAEAFAGILAERRIEFAFEGHRYKDLKRLGKRADKGIERDVVDCAINNECSLQATDFRFTVPVPLVELNANPNIQQNPNY